MGNHEWCTECETSDFHLGQPCDPKKLKEVQDRRAKIKKEKMKYKLYYCKSRKKTGDPIVVEYEDGRREFGSAFARSYNGVILRMTFNNAKGKAKRSGATTVLEVEEL